MIGAAPGPVAGTVVSIGYEGRSLDDFVDSLVSNDVDVLADVRLNPISRKRGFSKRALAAALAERGIEYRHFPKLGNPKDNREGFQKGDVEAARERYLAHLNNGARPVYEELVELTRDVRVALLCVEHNDRRCHRGCITDQAQAEEPELKVLHL